MGINSDFTARTAEATVNDYRIIKPGTAAGSCVQAAAATDKLLGTSGDEFVHTTGEVVPLALGPLPYVRLGGTVAAGDQLTSDANGKAIATTTIGNRTIGAALTAGVLDDIVQYVRAPGVI